MCGIAGKVYFDRRIVIPRHLKLMSGKIIHRGPDDEGIFISSDKKVGLVNRRLAIIDLTPKGHQPMSFRDRYWITFNGEIYNFQEEREKLEAQGYRFKSNTDTEVILALYDKYGKKCLEHLRGMFAFAIYDNKEKTLFLSRDRIGKKPLKYFHSSSVFIFASELKAILTQPEVKKTVDWIGVHHYLTYGFTPAPSTGFMGIYKLEPGHFMLLDLKTGKLTKKSYWKPDFSEKLNLSEREWIERILKELEDATKLRMISDVPIGAFLSGGVDSSGVVATMASLSKKPIKTFTIGFKETLYDEREYAERLTKKYKTEHRTIVAEPASVEILPQLIYQYEEPYANSSSIVAYMVSKLAREHVTVILNGDGGDENFAGYDRFRRLRRDIILDNFQWFLRPLGIPATNFLSPYLPLFKRANKFLNKSKLNLADRFVTYNCFFTEDEKNNLYSKYFKELTNNINSYQIMRNKFKESRVADKFDQALYADLTNFFPDDLLTKVDIASMAVSLEGRSPFLDHKMIELACKIPFNLKLNGTEHKYILKKALEKIVPYENLYRQKKGFSIPLSKWFSGELNKYTESKLLNKNARVMKMFKKEVVKSMLVRHSEQTDFGPKLWSLLTLELWFEKFFY